MSNAIEMSTPVTRGELREELASFATKAELANYPTKADLKAELANYPTKADLKAELAALTDTLLQRMDQMLEKRLNEDLARHVKAAMEWMSDQLKGVDDKYADLPERVKRLESSVFRAKRR